MTCNYCGRNEKNLIPKYREEYGEYLCWNCYTHYKEHPANTIPPKGVFALDEDGRVVCHICGRAYDRLTTHLKHKHGVDKEDYKEEFGLNRTQRLTSKSHRDKLRECVPRTVDITTVSPRNIAPNKGKEQREQAKVNRKIKKVLSTICENVSDVE